MGKAYELQVAKWFRNGEPLGMAVLVFRGDRAQAAELLVLRHENAVLRLNIMLILHASRRNQLAPPLARWCLGAGILATTSANLAHGLGHGPIGALVSAWPALALAGSFELLMTLIRTRTATSPTPASEAQVSHPLPIPDRDAPPTLASNQPAPGWAGDHPARRPAHAGQCGPVPDRHGPARGTSSPISMPSTCQSRTARCLALAPAARSPASTSATPTETSSRSPATPLARPAGQLSHGPH